jgi:heme/copper-type cytochrome/quinol oxidase subunit 2
MDGFSLVALLMMVFWLVVLGAVIYTAVRFANRHSDQRR